MKFKLPFKIAMLKTVASCGTASVSDIMKQLEPEYGAERQFTKAAVENHLLSLRCVGLIADAEVETEEISTYNQTRIYAITDYGRKRIEKLHLT